MPAFPILSPVSTVSVSRLPITGTHSNVNVSTHLLPYGTYASTTYFATSQINSFISGAVDQVSYVYEKLGGDILDVEITEYQVYAAYEESCFEYSYLINIHQGKNVLSTLLGLNATGSFNQDGQLTSGSSATLLYPKFEIGFLTRTTDYFGREANVGGSDTFYSASIDITPEVQDYDLQAIVSSSNANSSSPLFGKLSNNERIMIRRVFYKTRRAMWNFFGYYGGVNVVGNLSDYGQYADTSTFEVIPTWHNKLQALQYEDSIYTRLSHFSYEIRNNKIRLFPVPQQYDPSKMWFEFTIPSNPLIEGDSNGNVGVFGINNLNTAPFDNIPYDKINSIGKQWIRRFCLATCKEMLGQVRSKLATIPIPGESVTLNGPALVSEGKEEQVALREELKEVLDQLVYRQLAENEAERINSSQDILEKIPISFYVG